MKRTRPVTLKQFSFAFMRLSAQSTKRPQNYTMARHNATNIRSHALRPGLFLKKKVWPHFSHSPFLFFSFFSSVFLFILRFKHPLPHHQQIIAMNVSYSSVTRESTVSVSGTHSDLVSIYEKHVEQHGKAPSLKQLFKTAREASSSEHDRDVVRILLYHAPEAIHR